MQETIEAQFVRNLRIAEDKAVEAMLLTTKETCRIHHNGILIEITPNTLENIEIVRKMFIAMAPLTSKDM